MTIVLHDLCGAADRRFSPYCWRAKLALAHKGLAYEARPTPFTGIPGLGVGSGTVPVIEDGATVVADSFAIAEYLEDAYPDRPSLFGGPGGRATARFVEAWAYSQLHAPLLRILIADIHAALDPVDQPYFRDSRRARLGKDIDAFEDKSDARLEELAGRLTPLRATLARQAFLGGDDPLYADHIVFGSLQWARVIAPRPVLAADDPVAVWLERCLDLYGGVGRSQPAAGGPSSDPRLAGRGGESYRSARIFPHSLNPEDRATNTAES